MRAVRTMRRSSVAILTAGAALAAAVVVPSGAAEGAPGPPVNFVSLCNFTHRLADDPIVRPDEPGAAHSHDFFGNTSTHASSTPASMSEHGTTCTRLGDTAAYWVPTLSDGGVEVRPGRVQAYYTPAGKDPATIVAFPADLRVVAGPGLPTGWLCATPGTPLPRPSLDVPTCTGDQTLGMRVVFPDCWDGVDTDSEDHASHLAYNRRGVCPDTHPVPLPRLRLTAFYPGADGGDDVTLSSGGPETAHADFWNTWDQETLEHMVATCINAERACGLRGPR